MSFRMTDGEVEEYYRQHPNLKRPTTWPAPDALKQHAARRASVEPSVPSYPILTKTLRFRADLPPSVNDAFVNVEGKGRVLTKVAREYKANVVLLTMIAARAQGWAYQKGDRVAFSLYLHFADASRDIDNPVKLLLDAVAASAGFNDKVVDLLHVEAVSRSSIDPHCEVVVEICRGEILS